MEVSKLAVLARLSASTAHMPPAHVRMEAATVAHVVETWAARLPGMFLQPCYVADPDARQGQEQGAIEQGLIEAF